MVSHYRWDFIGLSTDSKPTATDPKVANGSTFYESDTSKLYVWYQDQWYEKDSGSYELPVASSETLGGVKVGEGLSIDESGVLSASGGGGGVVTLTSDDYDYPDNNPQYVAMWRLPMGIYQCIGIKYALSSDKLVYDMYPASFIMNKFVESSGNSESQIYCFTAQYKGLQITTVNPNAGIDGGDAGFYRFNLVSS